MENKNHEMYEKFFISKVIYKKVSQILEPI